MKTVFRSIALLCVLALTASSTARQDSVVLRMKFTAGESLRYRFTQSQTMESDLMGTIESDTTFVIRQNVKSVADDGTAALEVGYEAIKMETRGPMAMSYDSTRQGEAAKANDAQLAKIFEPMLAAQLGVKIATSGKVLEINGVQELLDKAFGSLDTSETGSPMGGMKGMFSEDSLRKLFELNVFPSEPLAPGATWKRTLDQQLPMFGALKIEFDNTFVGVESHTALRCAKIGVTGKLTLEKGDPDAQIPMEVSLDSPTLKGEMFLSLDNGRLIESEIETTMDMHIAAKSEGATGFELDMGMQLTQHMRLLGKDDPAFE